MFERLRVQGFLAVVRQTIVFDQFITCLVGKSAIGKSSLLRALRWVCKNTPSGDGFINWDAEKAIAALDLDGHRLLLRKKGKGVNTYSIDKKKKKAFGVGVPDAVVKLVNVSDVNFQTQFAPHFWFSLSPGEVGKRLNSIVNLDVIDKTLAKATSSIRQTNAEIKVTTKRLEERTQQLHDLQYVSQMDVEFVAVERIESRMNERANEVLSLMSYVQDITKYRIDQKNQREQVLVGRKMLKYAKKARESGRTCKSIRILITKAQKLQEQISTAPPSISVLTEQYEKIDNIQNSIEDLDMLITKAKQWRKRNKTAKQERRRTQAELKAKTKGRCPVCGSRMS